MSGVTRRRRFLNNTRHFVNLCPFASLISQFKNRIFLASVTAPSPHRIKIEPFIPGHCRVVGLGLGHVIHDIPVTWASLVFPSFRPPFPETPSVSLCDVIPPRGQLPFGHTLDLMPLPRARSPILFPSFAPSSSVFQLLSGSRRRRHLSSLSSSLSLSPSGDCRRRRCLQASRWHRPRTASPPPPSPSAAANVFKRLWDLSLNSVPTVFEVARCPQVCTRRWGAGRPAGGTTARSVDRRAGVRAGGRALAGHRFTVSAGTLQDALSGRPAFGARGARCSDAPSPPPPPHTTSCSNLHASFTEGELPKQHETLTQGQQQQRQQHHGVPHLHGGLRSPPVCHQRRT